MSICDRCEEYGACDCQHCDLGNPCIGCTDYDEASDNCRSNGACYDWYAKQDGTCPVVMHRKNNAPWKVTMLLEDWIRLYAEGME